MSIAARSHHNVGRQRSSLAIDMPLVRRYAAHAFNRWFSDAAPRVRRPCAHDHHCRCRAGSRSIARARGSKRWTATARLEAVIATAAMDEASRNAWCREQGLYPAELDGWKQDAIAGLGEPRAASVVEARQDRRRLKELERELHRKDKALAETAALLVLTKKLSAVFRNGEDE